MPNAVDPIKQAQAAQLMASLSAVPADVRKAIATAALGSQRKVMALPYYSTIRFGTTVASHGVQLQAGRRPELEPGFRG